MALIVTDNGPESVNAADACLKDGEILLYPTDTIYGLGCDALQNDGVWKIRTIKGREDNKPFILLAGGINRVEAHFEIEPFKNNIEEIWPGPFTILLKPKNPDLFPLAGPNSKIGLRIADDPFLKKLFLTWDGLLVSTSANRSGIPYTHDWEDIRNIFYEQVSTMVYRKEYPLSKPSAVIEYTRNGWKVYREGPFPLPNSFNICK